jgi:hypothetical protein
VVRADAGRRQPRPPGGLQEPARRHGRPPGGPPGPLLAVVRGLARRGARRPAGRGRAPQHPLRLVVERLVPGPAGGRGAHARPLDPHHLPLQGRPEPGPRGLQHPLRPRADAEPRRAHRLDRRARAGAGVADRPRRRARVPGRRRGRGLRRPARLGARRDGARDAVRPVAPLPADGTVPPEQRRQAAPGPRVRRLGHGARASGFRWCSSRGDSRPSASAG